MPKGSEKSKAPTSGGFRLLQSEPRVRRHQSLDRAFGHGTRSYLLEVQGGKCYRHNN